MPKETRFVNYGQPASAALLDTACIYIFAFLIFIRTLHRVIGAPVVNF